MCIQMKGWSLPCLFCVFGCLFLSGWLYTDPVSFKSHISHSDLVFYWATLNTIAFLCFIFIGTLKGINKNGLWISLPCILLGAYLLTYATAKLGLKRTCFGAEYNETTVPEYETFPFTLVHPQYKGMLLLIFGIWTLFNYSHEFTATAGIWIICLCFQMLFEKQGLHFNINSK